MSSCNLCWILNLSKLDLLQDSDDLFLLTLEDPQVERCVFFFTLTGCGETSPCDREWSISKCLRLLGISEGKAYLCGIA